MRFDYNTNEDLGRYTLRDAVEIERILRKMLTDKTIVTIHAGGGEDFLLTTLVGINPNTGFIYFDRGPDERINELLLASEKSTVTAMLNQVRIQFSVGRFERAKYSGEIVLKTKLPATLLRVQRREFYRLATPLTDPVKCWINLPSGTLKVVVTDISVGGIGVLYPPSGIRLVAGEIHHGCRLALPDAAEAVVSLKVCSTYKETMKNGLITLRAGCQFVNLPAPVETAIQRYILKIERERKART
ncbi:MAG: flagellar regulator YcgR PilZN domain-containing protein [Pseudomonadota bacterium]